MLKKTQNNQLLASGQINNQPVDYLVDTGAKTVAMPIDLARKLSLDLGELVKANTAGGEIQVYTTTLDSVQLGDITVTNVSALVNPKMHSHNGDKVLLGMSFLEHLDLEMKDDEMILARRNQWFPHRLGLDKQNHENT